MPPIKNGLDLSQLADHERNRTKRAYSPGSVWRSGTDLHPARVRLSLDENPFGPSRFALAAIRNQLGEVCRYTDDGDEALTREIVARENVSAHQIVLDEILPALGSTWL